MTVGGESHPASDSGFSSDGLSSGSANTSCRALNAFCGDDVAAHDVIRPQAASR
jgi:hypothetical protein